MTWNSHNFFRNSPTTGLVTSRWIQFPWSKNISILYTAVILQSIHENDSFRFGFAIKSFMVIVFHSRARKLAFILPFSI